LGIEGQSASCEPAAEAQAYSHAAAKWAEWDRQVTFRERDKKASRSGPSAATSIAIESIARLAIEPGSARGRCRSAQSQLANCSTCDAAMIGIVLCCFGRAPPGMASLLKVQVKAAAILARPLGDELVRRTFAPRQPPAECGARAGTLGQGNSSRSDLDIAPGPTAASAGRVRCPYAAARGAFHINPARPSELPFGRHVVDFDNEIGILRRGRGPDGQLRISRHSVATSRAGEVKVRNFY